MSDKLENRISQFLREWNKPVREDVSLRRYTSFSIGGAADYFIHAQTEDKLIQTVRGAIRSRIPFVVFGMGTNILVSDEGFRGLVIRNRSRNQSYVDGSKIWVYSGVPFKDLILTACHQHLTGLEFATGIPGTIGGALYINAGAFGSALGERVVFCKVITPAGKIIELNREEMDFRYRSTRLKKTGEVALGVLLQLEHGDPAQIKAKMDEILALRASKHPYKRSHNAGSYFKNIEPSEPGGRRQAAGAFLEKVGAKGMKVGGASVYEGHANFIINSGRAKAQDVLELATILKKRVLDTFNIELEEEVRYLDPIIGFEKD